MQIPLTANGAGVSRSVAIEKKRPLRQLRQPRAQRLAHRRFAFQHRIPDDTPGDVRAQQRQNLIASAARAKAMFKSRSSCFFAECPSFGKWPQSACTVICVIWPS
ncbi:MAG: hypothetical protein OXG09_05480 [Chloroflexi bacterium]|nr:hypothetical protein [Chloroflexota bacterium]